MIHTFLRTALHCTGTPLYRTSFQGTAEHDTSLLHSCIPPLNIALYCTTLDWTGLDWTGLDWTGLQEELDDIFRDVSPDLSDDLRGGQAAGLSYPSKLVFCTFACLQSSAVF